MKLLLLRILLQRRAKDEGFTLPMVIALGLVLVLLGAINITTAHEENLTAISQNSRSDAFAVAEVGIARYRELLDRNRLLAINNLAQWGSITQVCDSNVASTSWQTITDTLDLDNDGDTTEELGQYALVDYEYDNDNTTRDNDDNGIFSLVSDANTDDDPSTLATGVAANSITDENDFDDDGSSDARGILTVKGRAPNGTGEAQIEVEIPLRVNLDDMTNLAPALWIGDNTITNRDLRPLNVDNGNVVIKDQASTVDGCRDIASLLVDPNIKASVISSSRDLPPIDQVIQDFADARNTLSLPTNDSINTPLPNVPNPGQWLFGAKQQLIAGSLVDTRPYNPDTGSTDCPNIKSCRYYYEPTNVGGLTYTDQDLLTDGVARTTLLLNQPLTINATGGDVKIGSTSDVVNDSNTFEIYVDGNHDIRINATGGNTININAFIHAPQSTLTITGNGTVNINGSVWVGDFVNNKNGPALNVSPDLITRTPTASDPSTSGRAYKFYSTTNSRTPRPLTGSPTNWKTEQVD